MISPAAACPGAAPLHNTFRNELLEPARQQGRRGQRNTALEPGKVDRTHPQVTQNKGRPTFAEYLGGLGDWAKLSVAPHDRHLFSPRQYRAEPALPDTTLRGVFLSGHTGRECPGRRLPR